MNTLAVHPSVPLAARSRAETEPATRPFVPGPHGTHITVRGLRKSFAGQPLYEHFDLDIPKGRIVSVFGPNGCGKSTLINMVAGLVPMDGGEALFEGKTLRETQIGYVFQNYREALLPWKRAADNIRYALRLAGRTRGETEARLEELVRSFDVRFDLNRYPYELSGGQQQLVSIMRALAPEPEVLFLDEPFSALDYEMTLFMRDKLQSIFQQTGTTMVLVSHDLEEAVYIADRVLLLTRRPTRIAAWVDVDVPRARSAATLADPRFVEIKARCLDIFQREVPRH
ncbi:ABC transporter ATP-binding protein [Variovorax sp. J22P271]|uniref:ABC transporter ATP-binding protein n=1 Tax=Variovorax davisae TaxID=3053515 RepID=UPI002575AF0F|nr:ABC transporter ATP-binding protein [Variovorax sp. J22P271]MDM0035233.1 ABC transporter ATP-binding protein [Variovorax sp. J22P271]